MDVGIAALISWLATAALGGALVLYWMTRARRPGGRTRPSYGRPPPYIPRQLVIAHVSLAMTGLAIWAFYLVVGTDTLTWVTLAVIVPVALLGYSMFIRWLGSRRARQVARASLRAPTESLLPTLVVFSHGAVGALTVLLVLLTALRVNGS